MQSPSPVVGTACMSASLVDDTGSQQTLLCVSLEIRQHRQVLMNSQLQLWLQEPLLNESIHCTELNESIDDNRLEKYQASVAL